MNKADIPSPQTSQSRQPLSEVQQAKTVSEIFSSRVKASPHRPAYEYEHNGIWVKVTYGEYGRAVKDVALGLLALGIEPGSRISVWGDTVPEWTIIDLAIMAIGGATAGIYQTNTPEQGAYIINDSNSKLVVVDGPERLEKALAVRDSTPQVKAYITWGGGADEANSVYSFESLIERGRAYAKDHEDAYEEHIEKVTPDMTAVIIYTSGTTGPPKGAALSHANCAFTARLVAESLDMSENDSSMAFLPMSHVAEHVVSFFTRLYIGSVGYFSPDVTKIAEAVKIKSPTLFNGVPRVFEKVYVAVMGQLENASPVKRRLFHWALKQGDQVAELTIGNDQPVPPTLALSHKLADKLVLSKVRDALGGKVRLIGCGAAPIDIKVINFFNAIGIPFMEVYGMTESSGISHMNLLGPGHYRPGTVGRIVNESECRIADDGEILIKGPGIFQGYLNKEEATREAIDDDGWLYTGDIGVVDADGFLRITDRKKNLIITAGGKNVAPSNIELLISRETLVSQAVVIGDRRSYLVALITLSAEEMEKSGVTREEALTRVEASVKQANEELARYEQIKYYKVLDREFTIEDGEMTPTMKLKRNVVIEAHAETIEEMYSRQAPPSA